MFRLEDNKVLDADALSKFLARHAAESVFRYKPLIDAYLTEYTIFQDPRNLSINQIIGLQ